MSFKYIASPYTSTDVSVMEARFVQAEKFTAIMLTNGFHVYSPIVHCHELAQKYDLPTDFGFWQNYNRAMLSKASEIIVLRLPGWEVSDGVAGEIEFAKQCGIEVTYE